MGPHEGAHRHLRMCLDRRESNVVTSGNLIRITLTNPHAFKFTTIKSGEADAYRGKAVEAAHHAPSINCGHVDPFER